MAEMWGIELENWINWAVAIIGVVLAAWLPIYFVHKKKQNESSPKGDTNVGGFTGNVQTESGPVTQTITNEGYQAGRDINIYNPSISPEQVKEIVKSVLRESEQEQSHQEAAEEVRDSRKGQPTLELVITDSTNAAHAIEMAKALLKKQALQQERQGRSICQQAAETYRKLGAITFHDSTEDSLFAFRKSTELDPDNPHGWHQYGLLLHRVGKLDDAEEAYERVFSLLSSGKETLS